MESVGERIKDLRLRTGMSQVDFADKIKVSKQTLYKYENNIITNIPFDKVEAAAETGGVTPAYLMGWEQETASSLSDIENMIIIEYRNADELTKAMIQRLLSIHEKVLAKTDSSVFGTSPSKEKGSDPSIQRDVP
jgi:transcriptional regulator with XRE-family HTH domain